MSTITEILGPLERVTAELTTESAGSLEALCALVELRGALIERLQSGAELDPELGPRLRAVLEGGQSAAMALLSQRSTLLLQLQALERAAQLCGRLTDGVKPASSTIDLQG